MPRAFTLGLVVVITQCLAATATAQGLDVLQRKMTDQLTRARGPAVESFSGLLLYPEDIRRAVLDVSQYPDLVLRLSELGSGYPVDRFQQLLAAYPDTVPASAILLARYLEVVDVLREDFVITALVGQVYVGDQEFVTTLLDTLSSTRGEKDRAFIDAWSERLKGDPRAAVQLKRAAMSFSRQRKLGPPRAPARDSSQEPEPAPPDAAESSSSPGALIVGSDYSQGSYVYGFYMTPRGVMVVYGVPSYDFALFVLDDCDTYPHLAQRIYAQWEDREAYYWDQRQKFMRHRWEPRKLVNAGSLSTAVGGGPTRAAGASAAGSSLEDAVGQWNADHEEAVTAGFFVDDGYRPERFAEFNAFEAEYTQIVRDRGGRAPSRAAYLEQHPGEFPRLFGLKLGEGAGAGGRTGGETGGAVKIERRDPTLRQQVDRGRDEHRARWAKAKARAGATRK